MATLLSFIIPNFNSGDLLQETVLSIVSKKNVYEYEIIVVDGLSIDHSTEFLKKSNYKNILLIEQNDINVYDAMNKGIKASNGKWLMFLGAGDIISNSFSTLNLFLFTEYLIVYGNIYWKSKGIYYDGVFDLKKIFYKNICQQAILYNKLCFDTYSNFNIKYFINADYRFNLKIFIHEFYRIKYVDLNLCIYRGNGISQFNTDNFNEYKNIYILLELFNSKSLHNKFMSIKFLFLLIFKKIKYIFSKYVN